MDFIPGALGTALKQGVIAGSNAWHVLPFSLSCEDPFLPTLQSLNVDFIDINRHWGFSKTKNRKDEFGLGSLSETPFSCLTLNTKHGFTYISQHSDCSMLTLWKCSKDAFVTWSFWQHFEVGVIERWAEPGAPGHAEVGLWVAVVHSRVKDGGLPIHPRHIATPQVTMKHTWLHLYNQPHTPGSDTEWDHCLELLWSQQVLSVSIRVVLVPTFIMILIAKFEWKRDHLLFSCTILLAIEANHVIFVCIVAI